MKRIFTRGSTWVWSTLLATMALLLVAVASAQTSNISATPHNLSRTGPVNSLSNVRAGPAGETEICVFCHTPHGANNTINAPLWNRNASVATYTRYTSASMDANSILEGFSDQPAGSSVLCLSCHDGMVALGNVNTLRGTPQTIALNNTGIGGTMPGGPAGSLTGFTRLIGTDLTNDHPISVTYNAALVTMDGELTGMTSNTPTSRDTVTGNILGIRSSGYKPLLPLEPTGVNGTGQIQCGTCHDPHLTADKFLRLKRLQQAAPSGGPFREDFDQICLACHPKLNQVWAESAHANPIVADEAYLTDAATRRNFPAGTQVWQAACLNCHDTHSVQGSRRLLREGVESGLGGTGAGSFRLGSAITPADTTSSIESTCYQCHDVAGSALRAIGTVATSTVPEIRAEFARAIRMPIATADQLRNKREVHDIVDSDFMESPELLGKNNTENRHVECTDCHNPHRVRRASTFYGTSSNVVGSEGAKRTHNAGGTAAMKGADGNVASGVLRGTWGVEPVFGAMFSKWPQLPNRFDVKKGDPGLDTSIEKSKTYLTREYQLCFKCHSNYSNSDQASGFPALGNTLGGTSGSNTTRNYMTRYTNVAAEFGSVRATDPPSSGLDQGEASRTDGNGNVFNISTICNGGDCVPMGSYPGDFVTGSTMSPSSGNINHRSWHPVMYPTGRNQAERSMDTAPGGTVNMRPPWRANMGTQTMQCSDCHGNSASYSQGAGPILTQAQGPHGSDTPFLLKGTWDVNVRLPTPAATSLCGKCHDPGGGGGNASGYGGDHIPNDNMGGEACMYCHIAVPHGWKNKAFLVNLRCVGSEVAGGNGTECQDRGSGSYGSTTIGPYYVSARLRISTWVQSGGWNTGACGGGTMEDGCPRTGN